MIRMNHRQRRAYDGLTRRWRGDAELTWIPETGAMSVRRLADDARWTIAFDGTCTRQR